jgi:hypothetical protein
LQFINKLYPCEGLPSDHGGRCLALVEALQIMPGALRSLQWAAKYDQTVQQTASTLASSQAHHPGQPTQLGYACIQLIKDMISTIGLRPATELDEALFVGRLAMALKSLQSGEPANLTGGLTALQLLEQSQPLPLPRSS